MGNHTIEIEGAPYVYSASQEGVLEDMERRVSKLRTSGALTGDALARIRKFFRIKHIYHSNAIEGNALNVGETRQIVEQGLTLTGKSLKDQAEAKNLSEALDFLEEIATRNEVPIVESDVRQIHQLVLHSIDNANAGAYRTVPVEISGSAFKPPSPEAVPGEMQNYGQWLAGATADVRRLGEKKAILAAIAAHTWFVMIHPFIDGNGRVARLLLNLILMRAGIPIAVITKDARARYYDALEFSQASDLAPLVSLVLESIGESLDEYEKAVQEQREVLEWARSLTSKFDKQGEAQAQNEFEVWRNAMELLKSYFRQSAELLNKEFTTGQVYFRDFGSLEYEKYLSLRYEGAASRTWFFRVDFRSEERVARYLFFFKRTSHALRGKCDVTLHLAREEPPGSFNYEMLADLQAPNVPDIHEVGYNPGAEKFVAKGDGARSRQEKIDDIGKRFFDEVFDKHFSNK